MRHYENVLYADSTGSSSGSINTHTNVSDEDDDDDSDDCAYDRAGHKEDLSCAYSDPPPLIGGSCDNWNTWTIWTHHDFNEKQ